MSKISCIVIDDEFLNRKLITLMITDLSPDFNIVGEAENVHEGFDLISELKPDVVFLDIKMPDGSGFDLLKKFPVINFELVFITGFDEYALKAFEFNALDYVLKPIDMDKFKLTLDKVQKRIKNSPESIDLEKIIGSYGNEDTIITKVPIHYNNQVILLPADEIMYVEANEGSTIFVTRLQKQYISSKQLSDFEFIFNNFQNFVKARKDITININYIRSYSKGFTCSITMNDSKKIEIPRRKKTEILKLIRNKEAID